MSVTKGNKAYSQKLRGKKKTELGRSGGNCICANGCFFFFQKARKKKSKPSVHVQTNVARQRLATRSCLPLFFFSLFFLEWLRLYVFLQRPMLLHRRSWSACSSRLFCFSSAFGIANKSLNKCRLTSVNKKKKGKKTISTGKEKALNQGGARRFG